MSSQAKCVLCANQIILELAVGNVRLYAGSTLGSPALVHPVAAAGSTRNLTGVDDVLFCRDHA